MSETNDPPQTNSTLSSSMTLPRAAIHGWLPCAVISPATISLVSLNAANGAIFGLLLSLVVVNDICPHRKYDSVVGSVCLSVVVIVVGIGVDDSILQHIPAFLEFGSRHNEGKYLLFTTPSQSFSFIHTPGSPDRV